MIRHKSSQSGFTLVEAALVIIIGGILLGAGASMFLAYMQSARITMTQRRMQDIDNAITQYLNINGVLPCVASLTDPQDSVHFGVEVTTYAGLGLGNDCNTGTGGTFIATGVAPPLLYAGYNSPVAAATIVMGAVPVRTLNLPDQDIADAWGNRFTYTVTDALTVSIPTNGYYQAGGAISVVDSAGTNMAPTNTALPSLINPAAQYVLVSYGPDGAGSYTLSDAKNGVACPPAPALESLNCQETVTSTAVSTFRDTLLNGSGNGYDDYVIYHSLMASTGVTPTGLVAPFHAAQCPPGWQLYGGPGAAAGAPWGGRIAPTVVVSLSSASQHVPPSYAMAYRVPAPLFSRIFAARKNRP